LRDWPRRCAYPSARRNTKSSLVELGPGREFADGELPGAVVSLLRKREIGGGAIDLGYALGDDFDTGPDFDAPSSASATMFSACA